jgi:hypothetical protein
MHRRIGHKYANVAGITGGITPTPAVTRGLGVALLVSCLVLLAGGDPYGGKEALWHRYFETDPRLRQLYGTLDVPRDITERCEATRNLLAEIGGGVVTVEPPAGRPGEECAGNVIMTLAGSVPDAIVVSAHLDLAGAGEGAVDDFSGVVMLGMLATYFRDRPHRHTLVFVAFSGEETGQTGSRRFIDESPLMPAAVTAVVNLECLGVTTPHSWAEGSSDALEDILSGVGRKRGVDCGPISIVYVSADSVPFLAAGYPAITVEGIEPWQVGLLGTEWDRHSVVRGDLLDTTFGVLVDFVNALDGLGTAPDPANGRRTGAGPASR